MLATPAGAATLRPMARYAYRLARARLSRAVVGLGLASCAGACVSLPGPRMELSAAGREDAPRGVWWYVAPDGGFHPPVVGIEQRLSKTRVRQWLVDDRGVRCFEYHGGRLSWWGPPLSGWTRREGFSVTASLIRRRFGRSDEPGWPGPPLPEQGAAELTGSADLVLFLQRHWAARQTDPPPGLSPHDIHLAMDAADLTMADLLAAGM